MKIKKPSSWHLILTKLLFILFSLFIDTDLFSAENSDDDINGYTNHELKIGERLFNGLIKTGEETVNCASCHNTHEIDTFNWNPSAYEIALSYSSKSLDDFKSVLLNPTGKKMPDVHQDIELTDEQINTIKGFLLLLEQEGLKKDKPTINKLLTSIGLVILIIMAVIDITVTHKIRFKLIHAFIILGALTILMKILVIDAIQLGRQHMYQPDQPIKFSHLIHAGTNGTDCLYCHHTAEYSKSAGIPSTGVCMNCHTIIVEGTNSGKFEIAKIQKAMENEEPVKWIRVHNLPDHVFFSHAQHVKIGTLDCKECHGAVEERHEIRQEYDLSMGWCLDCHRNRKVQFVGNEYYDLYNQFHEDIKSGIIDSVLVNEVGGTDCMKCHY